MEYIPKKGDAQSPFPKISLSTDQIQYLFDILLSEGHLLIIDDHAGHAHDLIFLLQFLKMVEVVHLSSDPRIFYSDPLSGLYQIRAHVAGQGY